MKERKHIKPETQKANNEGERGVSCYRERPSKGVITHASSGDSGLGSERLKAVREQRGQSTRRPWLNVHVTYLEPPPLLEERR